MFPNGSGHTLLTRETEAPPGCAWRKNRRCDIGLEGYICFAGLLSVPISLHSSVVGILTVLDGLPRRFKDSESKALSYLGANLILTLHHSLYFPELGEQWLNLSRVHAKMLDSEEFGLRASFLIERTRHGKCIYRHPAVSCLGHPLPKGISEPTLLRILDFLQARQEPVSAKQLSIALSISDVTSGVYLSYLVESGLASRKVIHGRVGRPTLVYQPTEALSAISRLWINAMIETASWKTFRKSVYPRLIMVIITNRRCLFWWMKAKAGREPNLTSR